MEKDRTFYLNRHTFAGPQDLRRSCDGWHRLIRNENTKIRVGIRGTKSILIYVNFYDFTQSGSNPARLLSFTAFPYEKGYVMNFLDDKKGRTHSVEELLKALWPETENPSRGKKILEAIDLELASIDLSILYEDRKVATE